MPSFFPKRKLISFILTTLGIWTAGGFLVYYFVVRDIKTLSQEILLKRQEVNQLDYNVKNFDQFSADYEKVAPDVSKINETILAQDNFITFIQKLEKIAEETGMKQQIDLQKQEEKTKRSSQEGEENKDSQSKNKEITRASYPGNLVYKLNLEGTFPNFVKYLQMLENLNYYTNPRLINFTLKSKETKMSGSSPEEAPPQADWIQALIEAEIYTTNISN